MLTSYMNTCQRGRDSARAKIREIIHTYVNVNSYKDEWMEDIENKRNGGKVKWPNRVVNSGSPPKFFKRLLHVFKSSVKPIIIQTQQQFVFKDVAMFKMAHFVGDEFALFMAHVIENVYCSVIKYEFGKDVHDENKDCVLIEVVLQLLDIK